MDIFYTCTIEILFLRGDNPHYFKISIWKTKHKTIKLSELLRDNLCNKHQGQVQHC